MGGKRKKEHFGRLVVLHASSFCLWGSCHLRQLCQSCQTCPVGSICVVTFVVPQDFSSFCCLCQQSGLVKSLPVIRDFSTARSLLLSPLRSDQGVEPWEQQTEIKLLRIGARSVDASWVWLSASCVTVGKGGTEEEAASRQLYTAPTRPAGPTKPTVIPSQATQSPDLKQFRP